MSGSRATTYFKHFYTNHIMTMCLIWIGDFYNFFNFDFCDIEFTKIDIGKIVKKLLIVILVHSNFGVFLSH